jgi:hypothetical protein
MHGKASRGLPPFDGALIPAKKCADFLPGIEAPVYFSPVLIPASGRKWKSFGSILIRHCRSQDFRVKFHEGGNFSPIGPIIEARDWMQP